MPCFLQGLGHMRLVYWLLTQTFILKISNIESEWMHTYRDIPLGAPRPL